MSEVAIDYQIYCNVRCAIQAHTHIHSVEWNSVIDTDHQSVAICDHFVVESLSMSVVCMRVGARVFAYCTHHAAGESYKSYKQTPIGEDPLRPG